MSACPHPEGPLRLSAHSRLASSGRGSDLHGVLLAVKNGSKDVKNLDSSLAMLKKLNDAGLLESFVLFVRADAGMKQDYPAYRQNNRGKLKLYLAQYVMKNGGN